jgi:hypothetical protein
MRKDGGNMKNIDNKTNTNNFSLQNILKATIAFLFTLRKFQPIIHPLKISGDVLGQTFEHSVLNWCVNNGFPQYAVYPTELALKAILYITLAKWVIEILVDAYKRLKTLFRNSRRNIPQTPKPPNV